MSFRKRNIGLSGASVSPRDRDSSNPTPGLASSSVSTSAVKSTLAPGTRPSPVDGRLTTSTGTQSFDNLLAGHAGLVVGCSVLLEETGTTDYAGSLLRYYAAEGVVQNHVVTVIGVGEQWGRDLPGLVSSDKVDNGAGDVTTGEKQKMKIAWRYERLGEHGAGNAGSRVPAVPDRNPSTSSSGPPRRETPLPFCHSFDLTKRLTLPSPTAITFIPIRPVPPNASPFLHIVQALSEQLSSSNSSSIHRLIIPSLLSPAFYPPHASNPTHILPFLHSLRALLRRHSTRFTAMISLPLTLYPRSTGLVRWIEILSDGVIELVPFPHSIDTGLSLTTSGAATSQEEKPQGMVKVHCLPVFHEKGGGGPGGAAVGDDLAFTVSRRKFVIKPFSLPPVEGDTEAQGGVEGGKKTKVDIDF